MKNKIEETLGYLEEVYTGGFVQKEYSVHYISNTLFEPHEITPEIIQRIETIKRKRDGKTETRAA